MTARYRSDAFLVMDKRPGEVTAPPTSRPGPTLLDRAREAAPRAKLHHPLTRLDAEVSGAVLFALSRNAIERAEASPPAKRYLAVAAGAMADDRATWTWPVGAHPRRPALRSCDDGARDAQPAETRATVIARTEGAALLLLTPVTGRTHQLRLHAARAGLPLFGDTDYGGPSRWTRPDGGVVAIPRVLLHAWRVTLPGGHPVVEAPPHADLVDAWRAVAGASLLDALMPWRAPDR